jgi:hypothetical protein
MNVFRFVERARRVIPRLCPAKPIKKPTLGRSDRYPSDYGVRDREREERASEGPRIAAGILTKATSFTRLGTWSIFE